MIRRSMVLVVDDDRAMRRSLGRLLASHDFDVHEYDSAEALLAAPAPEGACCVVADLMMPGLSGLDLQRRLADKLGPMAAFVFLSGHGDVQSATRAFRAGAVDFLTKPVEHAVLVAAVREALSRAEAAHNEGMEVAAVREKVARLTPRERQVFQLITEGLSHREIGERLGMTERTVKAHRVQVRAKMGTDSLADLVRMADRLNGAG